MSFFMKWNVTESQVSWNSWDPRWPPLWSHLAVAPWNIHDALSRSSVAIMTWGWPFLPLPKKPTSEVTGSSKHEKYLNKKPLKELNKFLAHFTAGLVINPSNDRNNKTRSPLMLTDRWPDGNWNWDWSTGTLLLTISRDVINCWEIKRTSKQGK